MALITLADIRAAQGRIAGVAVRTPLVELNAERLRAAGVAAPAARIFLKDESAQPIGSFKLRGAYNKIAQLTPEQLKRGVITYSSGNHAQGVAFAARALGAKAVIVMPEGAPVVKREATLALGAEVVLVGNASSDRKKKAEELEAEFGYSMIPPYDDAAIISGQATCGVEILEQLPEVEVELVLSPVSGGGLLSGVSTGIKLMGNEGLVSQARSPFLIPNGEVGRLPKQKQVLRLHPSEQRTLAGVPACAQDDNICTKVFGCEPEVAGDATESFATKRLVEWPAEKTTRTICDGLRTQSLGALNFEHILAFTDGFVTVSEAEIRLATRIILEATDIVAEPSGAVTLAAALFHAKELPEAKTVVAIVSGGNIDPAVRAEIEMMQGIESRQ